jgi:hypothetical protein
MSDLSGCHDRIVLDGWANIYCARTDTHTLHQSVGMEWRRPTPDDPGYIRSRTQPSGFNEGVR